MPPEFALTEDALDADRHVVAVRGEIDLFTAPELKQKLTDAIEAGKSRIVVDRYLDGLVIDVGSLAADPDDTAIQGEVEAAVLDLIEGHESQNVAPAEELLAATA